MSHSDFGSYIPAAFQALTERSGKKGSAARFVDSQQSSSLDMKFVDAVIETYAEQEAGGESTHHMLTLLGLFQDLLDKCSWNARRHYRSLQREEQIESDGQPIYGVDTVVQTADEVGVHCDKEHVSDIIEQDYAYLTIEWSRLSQVVAPDRDDAQLYLFAPSKYDESTEQWVQQYKCESFGEALTAMDNEADLLVEKSRAEAKQKLMALRTMRDEEAA